MERVEMINIQRLLEAAEYLERRERGNLEKGSKSCWWDRKSGGDWGAVNDMVISFLCCRGIGWKLENLFPVAWTQIWAPLMQLKLFASFLKLLGFNRWLGSRPCVHEFLLLFCQLDEVMSTTSGFLSSPFPLRLCPWNLLFVSYWLILLFPICWCFVQSVNMVMLRPFPPCRASDCKTQSHNRGWAGRGSIAAEVAVRAQLTGTICRKSKPGFLYCTVV